VPPLSEVDADAMFVERARAVCPTFVLDPGASAEVAVICRQLDRLPLAIELAAARMRALDPRELLARLGRQMSLLTGGSRDAPDRHRTLRATINWSNDLLSPPERRLLARLSVFAGSGTLAAIETVCGGGLELDPLDGVQSLVDSSLLHVVRGDGEPRYSMLLTVRQFAAEQLAATPEADDLHRRHARFYLALAETAETQLTGAGQRAAVRGLEIEVDNLRAALASAASGTDAVGLRLAGALGHFWEMTSRFTEGRLCLSVALAAAPDAPAAARAKALSAVGTLAARQGDSQDAGRRHQEALALYRALDDSEGAAFSLNNLAVQAMESQDFETAGRLLRETLSITREPRMRAIALVNLGEIALVRGDPVEATHLHSRALEASTDAQDEWLVLVSRYDLAVALLHRGAYRVAARHLRDGLTLAHARSDPGLVTEYLSALATVAACTAQPAVAAPLLGAVETLRAVTGVPPSPQDAALFERAATDVRRALGPTAFAAGLALGRAWDLDAAVAAGVAAVLDIPRL
jgi:tetratricopeptide (TPR) repeat protein